MTIPRSIGLAAWLGLAACGGPTAPSEPPALLETLPRELTAGEVAAIAANNQLAFRLLNTIVADEPDPNAFVSPLSVSMALGLVMNGARGDTRDAMAATLGFGALPQAQINEAYRSLIALLLGLDERVEFSIANAVFTDRAYPVEPAFLSDARQYFDAQAQSLDFGSSTALATINQWVSDKTQGKIPTILDRIDRAEVLFAINAIYFKGLWRERFDEGQTRTGIFHAADGSSQSVPMMRRTERTPYYEGAELEAIDLWYGAGAHTMTVILPSQGTTATELAARLTASDFATIAGGLIDAEVTLELPRLRLEYNRGLRDDLEALGMGIAFDPDRADLSGIGPGGPFITRVEHKTFVDVNEEGTEAAAATAVGVGVVSAPRTVTFRVDRPFLLAIRERLSGTILFLGRINAIPGA